MTEREGSALGLRGLLEFRGREGRHEDEVQEHVQERDGAKPQKHRTGNVLDGVLHPGGEVDRHAPARKGEADVVLRGGKGNARNRAEGLHRGHGAQGLDDAREQGSCEEKQDDPELEQDSDVLDPFPPRESAGLNRSDGKQDQQADGHGDRPPREHFGISTGRHGGQGHRSGEAEDQQDPAREVTGHGVIEVVEVAVLSAALGDVGSDRGVANGSTGGQEASQQPAQENGGGIEVVGQEAAGDEDSAADHRRDDQSGGTEQSKRRSETGGGHSVPFQNSIEITGFPNPRAETPAHAKDRGKYRLGSVTLEPVHLWLVRTCLRSVAKRFACASSRVDTVMRRPRAGVRMPNTSPPRTSQP
ncbi:hypothetical protein D3C87_803680 [compost metagenome]